MSNTSALAPLKALLMFPFHGPDWRNRFLVGALVTFACFAIPILPLILLAGYILQIMRQTIRGENPALPAWENWGRMMLDGLRATVVGMAYMLPSIIVMFVGYAGIFASPLLIALSGDEGPASLVMILIPLLSMGVMFFSMFLGWLLMFLGAIPLPIATAHFLDKDQISAAFKLRIVWQNLKANAWGYLIAWIIATGLFSVLYIGVMMAYVSVVFCCLIPILTAPASFYLSIINAALFGQVYRESQQIRSAPAPQVNP